MDYYGIDIHKRYSVFTCLVSGGGWFAGGRVANTPEELVKAVAPSGGEAKVMVEATSNWGYVYDVVEPWVAEIVLGHPLRVKAISSAKVKTDRIDGNTLA